VSREDRQAFNERVGARAAVDLSSGAVWALARFDSYGIDGTREMAQEQAVETARVRAVETELRDRGLVQESDGEARLTPAGRAMADQLLSARREELHTMLADHTTQRVPEVQQLLAQLCVELSGQRP
jgi:DNA-binding MarR family transcriptional regulator